MKMHNPAHPGRILAQFIGGRSITAVAKHLCVTRTTLSRIIHGRSSVSADMALRLEQVIGLDAETWLAMQTQRDLWVASQKKQPKLKRMTLDMAA